MGKQSRVAARMSLCCALRRRARPSGRLAAPRRWRAGCTGSWAAGRAVRGQVPARRKTN